jgi:hypothetical protein
VILEGTIYCEAEDCKHQAHVGSDTMRADRLPSGWIKIIDYGSNGTEVPQAFCNANCLLKTLGKLPPPETYEIGPDGEMRRIDGPGETSE